MRKQTKLVAVLSAAALLAIGASMTSFAAKGWTEENGTWFYDKSGDGDYASSEWRKSGNNWFWLGDDGAMVTNSLVEDNGNYYYVNANGAMVTNAWVAVEPGDDADEEDVPDHYWYRFGANGKALKASENSNKDISIKTVNGKKYGFNKDGKMLYGWVSEDGEKLNDEESPFENALYYFGDAEDGAMHTDWLQYNDGSDLTSDLTGKEYADQDVMWFYFNTSDGKKINAEDNDGKLKTKTIRGQKYAFDEKGVMVYEWNNVTTPSDATSNNYFSSEDDGHLKKKGWIWAVPSKTINDDDNDSDTSRWFYVDGAGKTKTSKLTTIGGKKYIFDASGVMKSGLVLISDDKIYQDTVDLDNTAGSDLRDSDLYWSSKDDAEVKADGLYNTSYLYYFGNEETDGSMKTGKNVKVQFEDDTYTMAFEKSGKAMYKKDGSKLYQNGFLLSAGSDEKYKAVEYAEPDEETSKWYVVGTSGTITKKGNMSKDADDNYYAVYGADGAAVYFDTDATGSWSHQTSKVKDEEGNAITSAIAKFEGDFAQEKARDFKQYGYVKGCVNKDTDKWISTPNKDSNCE